MIFPKTLPAAIRDTHVDCTVKKQVFVVCPNEACNTLYKFEDQTKICTERNCFTRNVKLLWDMSPIVLMESKHGNHLKYFILFHLLHQYESFSHQSVSTHFWNKPIPLQLMCWRMYRMEESGKNFQRVISSQANSTWD